MSRSLRARPVPLLLALLVAAAISVPVFGADPSPSASPVDESPAASPSAEGAPSVAPSAVPSRAPAATQAPAPSKAPKPEKAAKPERAAKVPKVAVTLRGTVARNDDGRWPEFTLTSGGKTYRLSAGPPWWWGAGNPLAKVVGKTVTIGGEQATGSDEVDVLTIDGAAVRAAGRPPWAGGWKTVGKKHPGWAAWKAEKMAAKAAKHPGRGLGRETAPGQQTP